MKIFKRKKKQESDGYTYHTKPKNMWWRRIFYWMINGLIIICMFGGLKGLTNQQVTEKTYHDVVQFFNKQYLVSYFTLSENQQQMEQNKKFVEKYGVESYTPVTGNDVKILTVTAVENKSTVHSGNIYETINKVTYTTQTVQPSEAIVPTMMYIKLKTKVLDQQTFLVLENPTLSNFQYLDVDVKQKEDVKKQNASRLQLDGNQISVSKIDSYKKNLAVFFDAYSKDITKAETISNMKLTVLGGGKFDVEMIDISDSKANEVSDELLVKVPYKTPTVTFMKIYKITYTSNAMTAFEEIQ